MRCRSVAGFLFVTIGLLASCAEQDTPFPDVPNVPDDFNLATLARQGSGEGELKGSVAMFTHEVFHEYHGGLVSERVVCFDTLGHCMDYYYRDREICRHRAFVYDSLGRRVGETMWQDVAGISYDSLPLSAATSYTYSRNGRRCRAVIRGSDGRKHTFWLRFDSEGRISRFIYPDGSRFSYDYDSLGRLVRLTWPDASSEQYEYNSRGELSSKRDREGRYTWYAPTGSHARYDSLGRVIEEVVGMSPDSASTPVVATYVYDDHDNWTRRTITGISTPTRIDNRTFKYFIR